MQEIINSGLKEKIKSPNKIKENKNLNNFYEVWNDKKKIMFSNNDTFNANQEDLNKRLNEFLGFQTFEDNQKYLKSENSKSKRFLKRIRFRKNL